MTQHHGVQDDPNHYETKDGRVRPVDGTHGRATIQRDGQPVAVLTLNGDPCTVCKSEPDRGDASKYYVGQEVRYLSRGVVAVARVIEVARTRVRVQRLSSGTTLWKDTRELLTKEQADAHTQARGGVV